MSPFSIFRKREMTLKLPYHAGDHLEAQAGPRLIDVKSVRQAGAIVGDFDLEMSVDFPGGDFDFAATFRISVFDRVGDQFVDQKSQGNRVVRG